MAAQNSPLREQLPDWMWRGNNFIERQTKPNGTIASYWGVWVLRGVVFWEKPGMKVIDFDSVVKNTKSSKSITFMPGFSDILLRSRSFKVIDRMCYGGVRFLSLAPEELFPPLCYDNSMLSERGKFPENIE